MQAVALDGAQVKPLRDQIPLGAIGAVEPNEIGSHLLPDRGTADLDYVAVRELIFLPDMMSGRIVAYRVKWGQ